jgi:two-component system invasion response regulator UvrY
MTTKDDTSDSPSPIRVLHIDDHAMFREGIANALKRHFSCIDIHGSGTCHDGLELSWTQTWDLILLDISLGGRTGVDVLRDIRSQKKRVPVIILTAFPENYLAIRVFRLGAAAFVSKTAETEELVNAVRCVLSGRRFITPQVAELLASQVAGDSTKAPHELLSDREFVVLQYLAAGRTVKEIGGMLDLSIKTISTYRSRILAKMSLRTNADLTRYCADNDLTGST